MEATAWLAHFDYNFPARFVGHSHWGTMLTLVWGFSCQSMALRCRLKVDLEVFLRFASASATVLKGLRGALAMFLLFDNKRLAAI